MKKSPLDDQALASAVAEQLEIAILKGELTEVCNGNEDT